MLEIGFTFSIKTRFMSADIYTRAFNQVDDWIHARRLISVSAPHGLTPLLWSQMLEDREQIAHQPSGDQPNGQGWSRVGKKRANEKDVPNVKSVKPGNDTSSENESAAAFVDCCFAANVRAAVTIAGPSDAMQLVSDMSACAAHVVVQTVIPAI